MNEFNYTKEEATAMLTERTELLNRIAELEEQIKAIDKEFKKLPKQDNANVFGVYKVWWKDSISMQPKWDYIREHEPTAYEKSKVKVKSDYYRVMI